MTNETNYRRDILENGRFEVEFEEAGEMLLLDIPTFLSDEGLLGSAAFTARCRSAWLAPPCSVLTLSAGCRHDH